MHVAVDPQGDAVAVWIVGETHGTGAHLALGEVYAAVRPAGAAWQAPAAISAGAAATDADLAIDAQGNAVAVWTAYAGAVQSAMRVAGGAWQAPVDISGPDSSGLRSGAQVAVDPADDAVAVWTHITYPYDVVESALRPAGGAWQPPVAVSAADGHALGPDVAVDPAGNAVAIWSHHEPGAPAVPLQSAVRPAGGAWQAPVELPTSAAGGRRPGAPGVVVDGQGNTVAAWLRTDNTTGISVAQGAARPAGGVWQLPADVSAAGPTAPGADVAIDAQGNAIAVWSRLRQYEGGVVQGAVRPADGSWQSPVDLSAAGQNAGGAQVAIAASGDAIAVWSSLNGTNAVLQSAAYDSTPPSSPPKPPPVPPRANPAVAGLRLSPRAFRAARSGRTVLPASARTATRVSYTLNARPACDSPPCAHAAGGGPAGAASSRRGAIASARSALGRCASAGPSPATGRRAPTASRSPAASPDAAPAGELHPRRDPNRRRPHGHTQPRALPRQALTADGSGRAPARVESDTRTSRTCANLCSLAHTPMHP